MTARSNPATIIVGAICDRDGIVVVRRDGLSNDDLRQLATATRAALGDGIVALVGVGPDGGKAGLAVALGKQMVAAGASAAEIAREAAQALGGGTAKNAELVVGGGPNVGAVDDALERLRVAASSARG